MLAIIRLHETDCVYDEQPECQPLYREVRTDLW